MPRGLRILRVLFSLCGTFAAVSAAFSTFLLLSAYVYTPPGFEDWLASHGYTVTDLWVMVVLHGVGAVFHFLAAVRLGKGGHTGRTWALTGLVVEAWTVVSGVALASLELGITSAVDLLGTLIALVVGLAFPWLLLLVLLCLRSSREWFGATGA